MRIRIWILVLGVLLGLAARGVRYAFDVTAKYNAGDVPAATSAESPGISNSDGRSQ